MLFKNAFEQNSALHYVYEHLQLVSNLGRKYLLDMPFCTSAQELETEFDLLAKAIGLRRDDQFRSKVMNIRNHLHQINDIRPTLSALADGAVMDDIQLFEIKKTAILTRKIAEALAACGSDICPLENMDAIVTLLDPEHTGIPHFYVYSLYDHELAQWRARIDNAQSVAEAEECRFQAQKVEDRVRTRLSQELQPRVTAIARNLDQLAHLDLLLAKAQLAIEWNACRPTLTDHTDLHQLYNPEVAAVLNEKGRHFQPIDIRFGRETVLITGANMAGKSVLLKTVSLAQHLFQFGFYVPAESAEMTVMDGIYSSIGDRQSDISGLSSFAVEILTIHEIIQAGREGKKILALVDELARTTNPEEGKRIVSNYLTLAARLGITSLVTTHYSGINAQCRRLRVKGLQLHGDTPVTVHNIGDYIDYSLVETDADEVPMEAFAIARLLGIDSDLVNS